jgi:endonuclease-3 related protein
VGAILTQNTSWTNVVRALKALHEAGVWTLEDAAALPARRLERLIRSSGYFRQKARKLKVLARRAAARGGLSRWLAGPLPQLREELLSLWGVGPETADSILLYAGGREAVVVDAYTLRVGRRLGWYGPRTGYDDARAHLAGALPRGPRVHAELHALFVELAKRHCRKTSPDCPGCPLSRVCARKGLGPRPR